MEPKIRLKGFSGEWEHSTLGEVATIVGGGTPSTNNPSYWNGNIQWFTPTEVGHEKYVNASERTISKEGFENSSAKMIPSNSILLSSRATIGEASINLVECATNQGFQSLIPIKIELEFLYSLITTKKGELIRESNGSTFLEVSANKVRSLDICIPCKKEQKAIGTFFQNLDSIIQSTTKKIESLKQVKAASLQSMFPQEGETTPRVRFKGFEGEWIKIKFAAFAEINRGLTYTPNNIVENGVRVLRSSNIDEDVFTISNEDVFVTPNCVNICYAKDGDILVTAANGSPRLVGKHAIIRNTGSIPVVAGGFMYLVTSQESEFLNASMSSNWYWSFIKIGVAGGNGSIGNLNRNDLEETVFPIPSLKEERDMIASYFTSLDSQITLQTQHLEKLKQIKSACLDNMFV